MCLTTVMSTTTYQPNLRHWDCVMPETFAVWLLRMRLARGETLVSLGEKAGVSDAMISNLETGKKPLTKKMAPKIAMAFGVPVEDILILGGFIPDGAKVISSNQDIPELTRELDSDTAEMVHFYEGLSPSSRSISKTMIQQLREVERAASIGGGLPSEKEAGS